MLNARKRLISLRMTDEEYQRLVQASSGQGARCVSEFIRNAVLGWTYPPTVSGSTTLALPNCACQALRSFEERIERLEQLQLNPSSSTWEPVR